MKTFHLFLCGDVMIGRGIDQILPYPSEPQLFEPCVLDARDYISLAEKRNGKIHYPVSFDYIWGDAKHCWQYFEPIKIINLETTITTANDRAIEKQIHYRMNPKNIDVLISAKIDVCTLANNHILDWGEKGLIDTMLTLKKSNIQFAGVGKSIKEAIQPAIYPVTKEQRILIFSVATTSSGVPFEWSAGEKTSGLFYIPSCNDQFADQIINHIKTFKKSNDVIILSIHTGSNWGHDIDENLRSFAHRLIENGVDVIFGHSSHHPRTIEMHQGKPIFYGCGDFINDYEGITGYEMYRGDLSLMYFLEFEYTTLRRLILFPMKIKKMQLHHADEMDSLWLLDNLNKSQPYAAQFILSQITENNNLNGFYYYSLTV